MLVSAWIPLGGRHHYHIQHYRNSELLFHLLFTYQVKQISVIWLHNVHLSPLHWDWVKPVTVRGQRSSCIGPTVWCCLQLPSLGLPSTHQQTSHFLAVCFKARDCIRAQNRWEDHPPTTSSWFGNPGDHGGSWQLLSWCVQGGGRQAGWWKAEICYLPNGIQKWKLSKTNKKECHPSLPSEDLYPTNRPLWKRLAPNEQLNISPSTMLYQKQLMLVLEVSRGGVQSRADEVSVLVFMALLRPIKGIQSSAVMP